MQENLDKIKHKTVKRKLELQKKTGAKKGLFNYTLQNFTNYKISGCSLSLLVNHILEIINLVHLYQHHFALADERGTFPKLLIYRESVPNGIFCYLIESDLKRMRGNKINS